jgi:uracil-DNA glycosylase
MTLAEIRQAITDDPSNEWAKTLGYEPVYTASEKSKIMIVGQAPGRRAQESKTPWNDVSGDKLRDWLGLTREEFYNPENIALVPMDFYYPGKGAHGDLPPRKDFAEKWHPLILNEMTDIQLILLVGSYAQKYYLKQRRKVNLTLTVQAYQEYLPRYIPLVHPSPLNFRWRAKNPWFEEHIVSYARNLVRQILFT